MRENTYTFMARTALWIFYALLAYMPLHILLSTWVGTSFGVLEIAKVAKDIVLVVGFLLVLVPGVRRSGFRVLLRDKLVWLLAAYTLMTLEFALLEPTDLDAEILGIVYNLRFFMFFIYAVLLTKLFDPVHTLKRAVQVVLAVGSVVAVFGLLQYVVLPNDALKHLGYSRTNGVLPVFLIDEKPDLERVMSTLRDPNSLGSYLVIIAPLAAAVMFMQKRPKEKILLSALLVAAVVCVGFTFSRSAWLGLAVALAGFILLADHRFRAVVRKRRRLVATVAGVAAVLVLGGLFVMRDSYFVQNVILHSDQSTVLEDPNELRIRFFKESITNIRDNPWGSGPGTAGLASIRNEVQGTVLNENYYLQVATEVGVVGLALFLIILGVVALRLWAKRQGNPTVQALLAAFVGLALTNVLVHVWANEAVAYTWWGLAGLTGIVARNSHNKQSRRK